TAEDVLGDFGRRPAVPWYQRIAAREEAAVAGVREHDADAHHHVLPDGERAVELRDLERAADAQARDLARRERRDVATLVGDRAARDHAPGHLPLVPDPA